MISNIKMINFKGFKEQSINLSNFNVFIGKNSTGKSTVQDAIELYFDLLNKYDKYTRLDLDILNRDSQKLSLFTTLGYEFRHPHNRDIGEILIIFAEGYNEKLQTIARIVDFKYGVPRVTLLEVFQNSNDLHRDIIKENLEKIGIHDFQHSEEFARDILFINSQPIPDFKEIVNSSGGSSFNSLNYGFFSSDNINRIYESLEKTSDNELKRIIEKDNFKLEELLDNLNKMTDIFDEFNKYIENYVRFYSSRGIKKKYYDIKSDPINPTRDLGDTFANLISFNSDKLTKINKELLEFGIDFLGSNLVGTDAGNPQTTLISSERNSGVLPLLNSGSGIRQIIEILSWIEIKKDTSIILIEEPEVHLDPINQAKLVNYLVSHSNKYQIIFSTHSEHILTRIQILIAIKNNGFNHQNVRLYYNSKSNQDPSLIITPIGIQKDGTYPSDIDHFLNHATREQQRLMDAWNGKEVDFNE